MAVTETLAWGKLEMEYTAYGRTHVARFYVNQFGNDAGVGTFVSPGTPASLDALATALTPNIGSLYATAAGLTFGAWRGLRVTNVFSGSAVPMVEGTITPGSITFQTDGGDAGAVGQCTYSMRDSNGALARFSFLGAVYVGPVRYVYSSVAAAYKNLFDYVSASPRIRSKNGFSIDALIYITFDTNDGLTRRYRR